jgi:hypothetical protein
MRLKPAPDPRARLRRARINKAGEFNTAREPLTITSHHV